MTASATSILEMVRRATPAERADVLTELLNSDLGSATDTRVLKLPSATGKSEVIYLAVNRSRPPQTLPPKLSEEELAELRIRIEKQDESVDLDTLMTLVEREVARRIPNAQQIFDLLPKLGTPERQELVAKLIIELTGTATPGPVRVNGEGGKVLGVFVPIHAPSGRPAPKLTPLQAAEVKSNVAKRGCALEANEMLDRIHSDSPRRT